MGAGGIVLHVMGYCREKEEEKDRRNEILLRYSPLKSFVPRIKDRLRELVEHLGK